MIRAAIYARYSSDLQSDASIEDQIRICKERAKNEGWQVIQCYTDHAISGASIVGRPGVQQLIQDAASGKFDLILSEALDRLSRDQEDIAGIYKRMQFSNICMFTLSEGEITNLHIGLKGTMNALFLKDLALKVRRGQRGNIEKGLSGGGLPFGYEVVKKFDAHGEPVRGERKIVEEQADIIRRIMNDYVNGKSPRAIALQLNKENVPGPSGKGWTPSTIHGNRRRGIGILNNEIYVGTLVWNRQQFVKNPDTGKRVPRFNPESEWIRAPVPELRIVDDKLWEKVKAKQRALPNKKEDFWKAKRPRYLLSGLLKCGVCGGGFAKQNHHRYGCTTNQNKGTCANTLKIHQSKLEQLVLKALRDHLMDANLCKQFCHEYTQRMNELRAQKLAKINGYKAELTKLDGAKKRIVKAVIDGFANQTLKEELDQVEARYAELEYLIKTTDTPPVILHPNMANRYTQEVSKLVETVGDETRKDEAISVLRSLIDRIELTPNKAGDDLVINLHGELAGILAIAMNNGEPLADNDDLISCVKLVAEEGLEPPTRGL